MSDVCAVWHSVAKEVDDLVRSAGGSTIVRYDAGASQADVNNLEQRLGTELDRSHAALLHMSDGIELTCSFAHEPYEYFIKICSTTEVGGGSPSLERKDRTPVFFATSAEFLMTYLWTDSPDECSHIVTYDGDLEELYTDKSTFLRWIETIPERTSCYVAAVFGEGGLKGYLERLDAIGDTGGRPGF